MKNNEIYHTTVYSIESKLNENFIENDYFQIEKIQDLRIIDKEKIILKKPEIQMPIKRRLPITQIKNLVKQKSQYQTDIDILYSLLKEYKLIKLSEIVEIFGITKEKAEEWALILEESNLAILHYPAMGETELRAKA